MRIPAVMIHNKKRASAFPHWTGCTVGVNSDTSKHPVYSFRFQDDITIDSAVAAEIRYEYFQQRLAWLHHTEGARERLVGSGTRCILAGFFSVQKYFRAVINSLCEIERQRQTRNIGILISRRYTAFPS